MWNRHDRKVQYFMGNFYEPCNPNNKTTHPVRNEAINYGTRRHRRIDMGPRYRSKNTDDHGHGETKAHGTCQRVRDATAELHSAQAATVKEDCCPKELRHEYHNALLDDSH